jgi:hypothetical protein
LVVVGILTACAGSLVTGSPRLAPAPTAAPQTLSTPVVTPITASGVESSAQANGREVVWGAVSNCTCHEFVGTSSVAAAIDKAKIGANVEEVSETASDVFFYVAFDPKVTTRDRVIAAIKSGGGRIKAGPPSSSAD